MILTEAHKEWFQKAGIAPDFAETLGCRSVSTPEELPEAVREEAHIARNVPGVLLPWTGPDGDVWFQLRPDEPPADEDGKAIKYLFPKGHPPVLWCVRPGGDKILIVEGSKQCIIAGLYAPAEYSVYGIAGCWSWRADKMPIPDLYVVDGREVVVCFDADGALNPQVYHAAQEFGPALLTEGAAKVSWVRIPAGGTAGLDDLLASRKPDRRADYLANLIKGARPKIADKPPKAVKNRIEDDPARPFLNVDDDRLVVINRIITRLKKRWDGKTLFAHGGVLSRFNVDDDQWGMRPVDKGSFTSLISKTMTTGREAADGSRVHAWPDGYTIDACLSDDQVRRFTRLDQIATMPFVRPDGSICQTEGYDEETRTLLVMNGLDGVNIPEEPTAEQVAGARDVLLEEWLGDMPFADEPSRANALGLTLTPFVRGMVSAVPLAVVDGFQMGVGKNLLADCLAILVLGHAAEPKPFNQDDDENRKLLLPIFKAGVPLVVFDEAHRIHGANLARAITASTYSDRVLGVSREANFPNKLTMMSLGNQVTIAGDLNRRVYRIGLRPMGAQNPHERGEASFRHPDLKGWTRLHRSGLIAAALTLVRHWFATGQRRIPTDFGSFEQWQGLVGGILHEAGVDGFLGNRQSWRSESDFDTKHWIEHLIWLRGTFENRLFTAGQVREKAMAAPAEYQAPPRLEDTSPKNYARELGMAYHRHQMWMGGYRIESTDEMASGHVRKYRVVTTDTEDARGDQGTTGDSNLLTCSEKSISSARDTRIERAEPEEVSPPSTPPLPSGGLVTFDTETGSAEELHSYGHEFLRLGGYKLGDSTEVTLVHDEGWEYLIQVVETASRCAGHNIVNFDLTAMAKYYGLDMQKMLREERVYDTLLAARYLDPPMAKEKGVDFERRHNLDFLGKKYELGGKTADLKALAAKYGGFDQIPVQDGDYRAYLVGDIELNERLYHYLHGQIPDETYLMREHRVAGLAAQFSLNGFRVDLELLQQRFDEGEALKAKALMYLNRKYGIPLEDEKGKAYASPLATKAGKAALIKAFEDRGVRSYWVTTTGEIATSREAMTQLAHQFMDNKEIREICKCVVAVVTTRTVYKTIHDCLIGDRVHPRVDMKQSTGRWSLTKPGLTVMGKRGGKWVERQVFQAEPGHVVIACDLSQVDMRAVAGLSGDSAYIDMLRHEDPHAEIAQVLFGDREMREVAKPIGHGWNYGRGIKAISEDNDIAPDTVITFDREMRSRFPRLVQWQEEVREWAASGELLDNGWGRRMRPDPSRAHTQGPALMGQGAARDIMMEVLLRLTTKHPEVFPMLRAQVHDEVVLSVPQEDAQDVQAAVLEAMTFEWKGVPIVGDGGPTDRRSWGDVYRK